MFQKCIYIYIYICINIKNSANFLVSPKKYTTYVDTYLYNDFDKSIRRRLCTTGRYISRAVTHNHEE